MVLQIERRSDFNQPRTAG